MVHACVCAERNHNDKITTDDQRCAGFFVHVGKNSKHEISSKISQNFGPEMDANNNFYGELDMDE